MNKVVIIGSSAAGHSLALQLRSRNKQCSITLVTEEAYPCYDRRKLSGYFTGKVREKELFVAAQDTYARENITFIRESKAAGVNCDRGTLYLKKEDKRESIPFDLLAVCTGTKTSIPEIPGSRKEGVFAFDSLAEVKAAKNTVINGPVCLSGAWNSRAQLLAELLIGERKEVRLFMGAGQLPAQLPAGIELIASEIVEMIGESGLQAVKLAEGKIIGTSLCVITGPAAPSTEFLADAGVKCENGFISVDNDFRTSRENVFACGSVTGKSGSWEESVQQASCLSITLAGLLGGSIHV
jgi:nitrite reductase (NADH) large subunit